MPSKAVILSLGVVLATALAAGGALAIAVAMRSGLDRSQGFAQRVPVPENQLLGGDRGPGPTGGRLISGDGVPSDVPGSWPQFRGPDANGIAPVTVPLARSWPAGGPPVTWSIDVGEGYAGPVVHNGCVYLMDYDREQQADALRCLSLADGREIWRYTYPVKIKRNHGMSRTAPAVNDQFVVAIGPKCHVTCVDAKTGQLLWSMDLVEQFGTAVPDWYAGQCPLLEGDRVIIAPAGSDALMIAIDGPTGEIIWQSPNPRGWKMTHVSPVPAEIDGRKQYVYCGDKGVAGIAADDGALLWETTEWYIPIATVTSPVHVGDGRLFFSGGYNAGAKMMEISTNAGEDTATNVLFTIKAKDFGATQHTPILVGGHLYGIRPRGELVCLDLEGNVIWDSGRDYRFGLGPLLVAGDLIYALNEDGRLVLAEANPGGFTALAEAQVLGGHEAWAPLALAGSYLLVRDSTNLRCLNVGK